jgi:hypothetical protein
MNSSVIASSAHDWLDVSIGSVAKFFAKAALGRKLAVVSDLMKIV